MSTLSPATAHESPSSVLLRTAYNALASRIFDRVVLASEFDDLRPAHGNVMEQLDVEDGLRLTDLADRAAITAQSMGELVDDLEAKDYVERRPDPDDRRAKRIHLTARGRRNIRAARQATAEVEVYLAELLGAEGYRGLREALEAIIGAEVG